MSLVGNAYQLQVFLITIICKEVNSSKSKVKLKKMAGGLSDRLSQKSSSVQDPLPSFIITKQILFCKSSTGYLTHRWSIMLLQDKKGY
jgi:hypothetical protein